MIFSSSAAIYASATAAVSESDAINPVSVYGSTKKIYEKKLTEAEKKSGMKYVCLRYFNVSGSAQKGRYPPGSPNKLINAVAGVCMGVRKRLYVYGNHYQTKDGTAIRDYVHIDDVVNANVLALEFLVNKNRSNIFNVGSGVASSVMDVVSAFADKSGHNISFIHRNPKSTETPVSLANISKISMELGWHPSCSGLSEIISDTFKWYQNYS